MSIRLTECWTVEDIVAILDANYKESCTNQRGAYRTRSTASIFPEDIHKILIDDGYRKIDEADVLAGDVVLYVNADGDIEHSGIVIRKPELRIPWVVSKCGDGEEFVHPALMCS